MNAFYLLKTHDGHIIGVRNRVLVSLDPRIPGHLFERLVAEFEAPLDSPYTHLHDSIFIGELGPDYDGFVNVNIWKVA